MTLLPRLITLLTLTLPCLTAQKAPLTHAEMLTHIHELPPADTPLVPAKSYFEEKDGLVVIEAEHFHKQTRDIIRRWYINSPATTPAAKPDLDANLHSEASGLAYVEALPDTFVTEHDRAIDGINLGLAPGSVAVLHYRVKFTTPGRYYLWSRLRSNDEEDNTINAGLNDEWRLSSRCLQYPTNTKKWIWNDRARDPRGPSFPRLPAYIDVPTAGVHTYMISMREDGAEVDKLILTMDEKFPKPEGTGPEAFKFVEEPAAPAAAPKK